MMRLFFLAMFPLVCSSGCAQKQAKLVDNTAGSSHFNTLSEQFLAKIKNGEDTKSIQEELANTTIEKLNESLRTDEQKFAFWVNIYNAYIQVILAEHPEYYDDRRDFFSKDQINIAGEVVAFSTIEHGIIRRSQWELGLGYFRKWFTSKFERQLRVEKRDYRVHFVLNCGAKDCPPVGVLTPKRINEQFEKSSRAFLTKTSNYDTSSNSVSVTPLFSWFRGDFGGKKGVKNILAKHNIIPNSKGVAVSYTAYDWTLDLDNFIDL